MSTFIIAEAGVNHNCDLGLARDLIDAAKEAGADAVKFQTFDADALVRVDAPKAGYQIRATGAEEGQHEMLRRLQIGAEGHRHLLAHCRHRGIEFMSTPFDLGSLAFLVEELGLERLKISSGEITNGPVLLAAAGYGRPMILSTGMATMREIGDALAVIAFGLVNPDGEPSEKALADIADSDEGAAALRDKVTILQCTTDYPTAPGDANLNAMATLSDTFGVPAGFSDHTEGTAVPIAAAALGARIIEKHLTLDRKMPGPDHAASIEPEAFAKMVAAIRVVEQALGDGVKRPTPAEEANRKIARRSLVATRPVAKGEAFTPDNLGSKRPASGVSPMRYWEWLGRKAERSYDDDEAIDP